MCEILDQFSQLGKNVFTGFSGVEPWKEWVLPFKLVTVDIDETEQAIDQFVEYVICLS